VIDSKYGLIEPERAAALYRRVIESHRETAIPMLLAWPETRPGTRVLVPVELDEDGLAEALIPVLAAVRARCGPLRAVLLNGEAWVHGYTDDVAFLSGSDEVSLQEAIVLSYVDRSTEWTATQAFARTRDGVRWHDLTEPEAIDTPSLLLLRAAVRL
jgi:hypothetical protein